MKHEDAVKIEKKVFCDDVLIRFKRLEMPATTAFELGRVLEWMQEKLRDELDHQVFKDDDDIWNEPLPPGIKMANTKNDDKVMLEGEVALDDYEDLEDEDLEDPNDKN